MEATARVRDLDLTGYVDGVSGLSCADLSFEIWLKRPGYDWEGPFLNVDCAQRNDIYGTIVARGEVIEVGFTTAERWGLAERVGNGWRAIEWRVEDVELSKLPPEHLSGSPVRLRDWYLSELEFISATEHGVESRNGYTNPWWDTDRGWYLRREFTRFYPPEIPEPTPTASIPTVPAPSSLSTMLRSATETPVIFRLEVTAARPEPEKLEVERQIRKREEDEVHNYRLTLFTCAAALLSIGAVTIRDWKRLGGKRDRSK